MKFIIAASLISALLLISPGQSITVQTKEEWNSEHPNTGTETRFSLYPDMVFSKQPTGETITFDNISAFEAALTEAAKEGKNDRMWELLNMVSLENIDDNNIKDVIGKAALAAVLAKHYSLSLFLFKKGHLPDDFVSKTFLEYCKNGWVEGVSVTLDSGRVADDAPDEGLLMAYQKAQQSAGDVSNSGQGSPPESNHEAVFNTLLHYPDMVTEAGLFNVINYIYGQSEKDLPTCNALLNDPRISLDGISYNLYENIMLGQKEGVKRLMEIGELEIEKKDAGLYAFLLSFDEIGEIILPRASNEIARTFCELRDASDGATRINNISNADDRLRNETEVNNAFILAIQRENIDAANKLLNSSHLTDAYRSFALGLLYRKRKLRDLNEAETLIVSSLEGAIGQ